MPGRGVLVRSARQVRQVRRELRRWQGLQRRESTRLRTSQQGAARRRRRVWWEIGGAVLGCYVGFRLMIDPTRHLEMKLSEVILRALGEQRVSTVLDDSYLVFVPDGPPIVANLTPACSALGTILALSALAFLAMRQRPQAAVGLSAATLWAIGANQVRLVLSLLAGVHFGMRSLVLFHDWVGAALNFCFVLIGLLIMVAFTMHRLERAEQDRSGRHTARRPLAWGRPGLGYRTGAEETLYDGSRFQLVGWIHRRVLPVRVSQALGARRERSRVDYRLGHLPLEERIDAVRELVGHGLATHEATLLAVASYETDGRVLGALADAVASRQWEPVTSQGVGSLRLWARAWLMRRPVSHECLHRPLESAPDRLIAVTGAGGPAGVAVIRALLAAGERVLAIDADPDAVGLRLACEAVVLPRADTFGFGAALLEMVSEHQPCAIICTVAEEYGALMILQDTLTDLGCRTWLPSPEAAEACLDKKLFAKALARAGVPHPPTAGARATAGRIPGPWIVKPTRGRGSRDVILAETTRELTRAFAVVPDAIAQTCLTGREFTADALVDRDGTLLSCVPRWRDETKAGISVRGTTFDSGKVTRIVADTLAAVGLTGPANVQGFVEDDAPLVEDPDADVTVTVVEVNPRFSGGLPLTLAAGADVVGTYLAGILDPAADLPRLTFAPGVRMARHFTEVFYGPDGTTVADPLAMRDPLLVAAP